MKYTIELKSRAEKDLKRLDHHAARQITSALSKMRDDLTGDVKRLTNFSPEFRLRVGHYRVLFEVEDNNRVVVYRIRHRSDAYR
jgi:mRNA interferase RelE/StbE